MVCPSSLWKNYMCEVIGALVLSTEDGSCPYTTDFRCCGTNRFVVYAVYYVCRVT